MKRLGWLICLINLTAYSFADVYKWVDGKGTVHFSDIPHTGASIVQLPANSTGDPKANSQDKVTSDSANLVSSNTSPSMATTIPSSMANPPHLYTVCKIKQPQDHATIWDNTGSIPIIVDLTPPLMRGDLLQALVDGKPSVSTQQGNSLTVTGIDRGAHQIQAQILAAGKVLSASEIITVYLHKSSIKNKS